MALALFSVGKKRPEFDKVGPYFREEALQSVKKGLNVPGATFDEDVSEAVHSLSILIFSDPSENRALGIEWTSKWIASFGANENNPIELWKRAALWKDAFIWVCRTLDEFKVI